MDNERLRAQELHKKGNYKEALPIYEIIWDSLGNKKIDKWLGWEYADTLKRLGKLDEAINICKKVYLEVKDFKYINDLLSWSVYEKYFKDLKDLKDRQYLNNLGHIINIANYIINMTSQEPHLPYEKIVWKMIKLYKSPFNAYEMNKWLDKLDINLLSSNPTYTIVENKNVELASYKEQWFYLKCKTLYKLKKYEECIELCDVAISSIEKFHNNRDVWMKRDKAQSMAILGDKEGAINLLKQLLIKTEHWTIYETIFQIQVELKNYDEALVNAYTAALTKEPPKLKINLYFDIGSILEIKEQYKYALMHYFFSKKIREENGWSIPDKLNDCIDSLTKIEEVNPDNLFEDLKKYWIQEKVKSTVRYEGVILKLLPNGKAGFIKTVNGNYYFKISSFIGNLGKLAENKAVTFNLVDSFDKKRDIKTKEAVDIVLK